MLVPPENQPPLSTPQKRKIEPAENVKVYKPGDRRFCKNCPKAFTVPRPPADRKEFCSDACRKEFHQYGGTGYRQLKHRIERLVKVICERKIQEGFIQRSDLRKFPYELSRAGLRKDLNL